MLYETGEVHFCLFGTNGFYVKAENEKLSLRACVVLRTSNMKPSRRPLADYVRDCTKKRAARAARLIFLIQPTKSWICGVVVVVAVVISLTPQCVFNTTSFPNIHPLTMPTPYCNGFSCVEFKVSFCISYHYVPQRRQNDLKMALIL